MPDETRDETAQTSNPANPTPNDALRGNQGRKNHAPETSPRYWHGGAPGLRPGDLITPRPDSDTRHLVDGCPTCEARKAGQQLADDDNNPELVYITTDREYARLYAAGYPRGALYRVQPIGELTDRLHGEHDPVPSWGCTSARVLTVYDAVVTLTPKQLRQMRKRWTPTRQ